MTDFGFGVNLRGTLINSNLSVLPGQIPIEQGDGSLEVAGKIYTDNIQEFNASTGVLLQNSLFYQDRVIIPYSIPSDSTVASLWINGGITINHTANATSLTSGGALTTPGGMSIGKNVHIGGTLDMHSHGVVNVPWPINLMDAVNKEYADTVSWRVAGNFTTGQIIFAETVGTAIMGSDLFRFDSNTSGPTQLNIGTPVFIVSPTNGNALSISGGSLDMNNNYIHNVEYPLLPGDGVNKEYVDDRVASITFGNIGNFTMGQVIIADTSGTTVRGYDELTYDVGILRIGSTSGGLVISSTTSAPNMTSGGVANIYGGVNIYENVNIGGIVDVNNNYIHNVEYPLLQEDAVNKQYVDDQIANLTFGNLNGNFTSGQVIIADTSGTTIRGYSNFTFERTDGTNGSVIIDNNTKLHITNTTAATSECPFVVDGGAMTVDGGASFGKSVYIGGQLDMLTNRIVNVADPIEDDDAVNKEYVDSLFGMTQTNETVFILDNNVLLAEDVPGFIYPSNVREFLAYVYVKTDYHKCCLYTLRGMNKNGTWVLCKTFTGALNNATFFIEPSSGQVQYTNSSITGVTLIKFHTIIEIYDTAPIVPVTPCGNIGEFNLEDLDHDYGPNDAQEDCILDANTVSYMNVDLTELTFDNTEVDGVKVVLYISNDTTNEYECFFMNCLLKNDTWVMNTTKMGMISGITFRIVDVGSTGVVQYTNINGVNYNARVRVSKLLKTDTLYTFYANTTNYTDIDASVFKYGNNISSFQLSVYVETGNKYALYDLEGFICDHTWKINSRYIGDELDIYFGIKTISDIGYIQYINNNPVNAYIRYIDYSPIIFDPSNILPVYKGGTGRDYIDPYDILIGNGTDPILTTNQLKYQDNTLIIGTMGSVLIQNTIDSNGTSTGALIVDGGVSIKKNVYIGGQIDMTYHRITSVADPIDPYDAVNKKYIDSLLTTPTNDEIEIILNNNVLTPEDIPIIYPSTVKAFLTYIYVDYTDTTCALYTLRGKNEFNTWSMSTSYIGQRTLVNFYIRGDRTNQGIIQYTNYNQYGITSIKYHTVIEIDDTPADDTQINGVLNNNTLIYDDIPDLNFVNTELDGVKVIMYVSNESNSDYTLYFLNCVLKNNAWHMNVVSSSINNYLSFQIITSGGAGKIQYTNINQLNSFTYRFKTIKILKTLDIYTLEHDIHIQTNISTSDLVFGNNMTSFQITVYAEMPSTSKYALYEIEGYISNALWKINSRYIGDNLGIMFYIDTVNGIGYLQYTNSNSVNAYIKYLNNTPIVFDPSSQLPVYKGGTGQSFLLPYAVLRGNGTEPIIGTQDFIYEDFTLKLGDISSIVLYNTENTTSITAGTIITNGGMAVKKNLVVGDKLIVDNVDITPNSDDIIAEVTFDANNNVSNPSNISEFNFSNSKSFVAHVCVCITTGTDELDEIFTIKGLKKRTGWIINSTEWGDDTGIVFSITSSGQMRYISRDIIDWESTVIKFKATTTSL